MSKLLLPVLVALPVAMGVDAIASESTRSLNLILTAATHGEMLPCGHCRLAAGGLARRAALVEACRDTADAVMAADGGDLFRPGGPDPQIDAYLLGLLARLGYTALGVGEEDLARGAAYLGELARAEPGLDWVSANVVDAATRQLLFAPYVVRPAAGARVGFTSCLEPKLWEELPRHALEVAVLEPAEALAGVVAAMRKECDLVVCLVHTRYMPLRELLSRVEGIDIAVMSHKPRVENYPQRIGNTRQVYFAGSEGRFVNWAHVELGPEGAVPYAGRTFYLIEGAAEDSAVAREILGFLGTKEPPAPDGEEEDDDEDEDEDEDEEEGEPR
jgi:2',3'-cyclic-nucleotide 2'-phosphodiesterase (5'-nucleotidase family)